MTTSFEQRRSARRWGMIRCILRARVCPSSSTEWEGDCFAFLGVVWVGEPPPLRRGLTREGMKAAFDCQGEREACFGCPDILGFAGEIR